MAKQQTIGSEEWYAGKIPRNEAERLVLSHNLPKGTFLIREREAEPEEYALTIRDSNDSRGIGTVVHYKIRGLGVGNGFCLQGGPVFSTLQCLVGHYSRTNGGLCCLLTVPALPNQPTQANLSHGTHEDWDIPRNQLQVKTKVGEGIYGEVGSTKVQYDDSIRASLNSCAEAMASKGLIQSCVTGFGQKYVLYGTQSLDREDPGYQLWMITANLRNIKVLSEPMKLSTKAMDEMQILTLMNACEQHFASYPPPGLSHPPPSCVIPVNSELISFSLIDLFNDTERLLPGDEVFVNNYLPDGRIWNHSAIHIGGGFFCHFVPTNGFNQADLDSGNTVPGVVKCVTTREFYEAVPSEYRQAFRVTHPILVREGLTIVDQAKRFVDVKVFNDYNYVTRNCQHFSSRCSYDREFSYSSDKLFSSNKHASSQKVATVSPIVGTKSGSDASNVVSSYCAPSISVATKSYSDSSNVVSSYCAPSISVATKSCSDSSHVVSKYCATSEMLDSEEYCW